MKTAEIRRKFIDFFKSKEHTYVPSSSTIPADDPTILFTIAGMAQFKAALTGQEIRPYKRATNAQKCVRAKDLDDVGKDGRHCTFFEMLGSWSFGDYYKKEAIDWAYEFVKDELKFDLGKLWVSVHTSDDEALELWKKVGQPAERIVKLGDDDNFWSMGPTGPCGPCTELHIDQGPEVGKCHVKGYPCKAKPGCDCDRFMEFWNLVFMQFDRKEDGSLVELPFKSVDTGSGLERVAFLSQGKTSAFDIDTFLEIKKAILTQAGLSTDVSALSDLQKESLNVVCDHIRMLTFTIADGATFGNEGRGYVLRRVLRRAARHVHRLAPKWPKSQSFLAGIVGSVVSQFADAYPEIRENQKRVVDLVTHEEQRFLTTLENGLERFNSFVEQARAKGHKQLPGEQMFVLHDSFGFPSDLTRVLCDEIGFTVDSKGFELCMSEQREKSRAEARFYKFDQDDSPWVEFEKADQKEEKQFVGYGIHHKSAHFRNKEVVEQTVARSQIKRARQLKNKHFEVVIARTPFYPESGGQVADSGWIRFEGNGEAFEFEVVDVRKTPAAIIHVLRHDDMTQEEASALSTEKMKSIFANKAVAILDFDARMATARNHTATHLLHKALQVVLGDGVRQAGSLVAPHGLRFDFSHNKAVTADEMARIEEIVNAEILRNTAVVTHEDVPIEQAKKMGAMAMFDEKYEDRVRVLEVPGFSLELCGGTHVPQTGTIGLFKITSEGSVTSGVRRIEAITGLGVYNHILKLERQLSLAADEARSSVSDLIPRIAQMRDSFKEQEKTISVLQSKLVNSQISDLLAATKEPVPGVKVITALLDVGDVKELELFADRIKEKHAGVTLVGSNIDGKAVVLAAVNPALQKQYKNLGAGNIVKAICEQIDGKGGGRPDFARGGGSAPEKLPQAFAKMDELVRTLVK